MSLKYEPSLEQLLITDKPLFSNRELHRSVQLEGLTRRLAPLKPLRDRSVVASYHSHIASHSHFTTVGSLNGGVGARGDVRTMQSNSTPKIVSNVDLHCQKWICIVKETSN